MFRLRPFLFAGVPIAAAAGSVFFATQTAHAAAPAATALSPKEFRGFKLIEVVKYNNNTSIYRFDTGSPSTKLGLTVASCLVTRATIDGQEVVRPYTPISPESVSGHFDLLVKEYPTGVMSKHIAHLKVGDTLEMKGPFPKLKVTTNMKKKIGMIAGGTGITPMLQVLDHVLADPADTTEITLLFANVTEADILLKEKLDKLAKQHKRFKVVYILDNPAKGSPHVKGRTSAALLKQYMPPPSPDHIVLVCGPPPMMNAISGDKAPDKSQGELSGFLKDLGYTSDQVYKF
eukprot:m.226258 g.226258  ORF g.226258 m.226258 type:complete len:289 (-) comp16904_c0_seq1:123-989(-)